MNHTESDRPIIISNAEIIKETCRAVVKFPYLRYDAISEFYTEQPTLIRIKVDKDTELDVLSRYSDLELGEA